MKIPEKIQSAVPIVLAGFFASVVSLHSSWWYIPLIFSIVSSFGILSNLRLFLYSGLAMTGATFAYINRFLPYSELALIRILAVYLVLYVAWRLSVSARLFSEVSSPDNLLHVVTAHHTRLLVNASLASVLSFIGTLMAFQGYRGAVYSPIVLFLVLTLIFFILLMYLLRYLPEHLFKSSLNDSER